jgi:hypothetical protein
MVTKLSNMNQLSSARYILLAALLFASGVAASAADRFSLAVGSHDMLVVFGPNGNPRAELPLPSISQDVTIGDTTCQISFGRDANNLLTAIVAPNPNQPEDLHFTVLGQAIDTDKSAVVTLTFSKTVNNVKVDPGYVGSVDVNSQRLQHDAVVNQRPHAGLVARTASPGVGTALAGSSATRPAVIVSAVAAAATTTPAPSNPPITTPVPSADPAVASNATANDESTGAVSDHNPLPLQANDASQMPFTATATPGPSTVSVAGSELAPKQHALYWAEPITPPSGPAPQVASNEMKLIEVNGSVSVTPPGGSNSAGTDGMILASGTTVSTSGGSSAAVFMGGVNSVRLMPDTEVQITQQLNGSVRKTVVALRDGTVFSRVGHRAGETQNYQVQSPEGVAMAKGTEFADVLYNGHHYVFVVKGVVAMLINGVQTGLLTPTNSSLASGAMPLATDGDRVLFHILTALQPFQTKLQTVIADINAGNATPAEIGYFDSLRNTFSVLVDDVYDPTHPNSFLGAFTSNTGYGDSFHSSLERPQDFGTPNPLNQFSGFQEGDARPFATPAVTPGNPGELPPPSNPPNPPLGSS